MPQNDTVDEYLNKNYKFGIILAAIGVVFLSAILFLYDNYSTEAFYRRGIYTPFWTMLENSTEEVRIRQGETITMPVELHYWNGLKTLLGIQFEEPEAEQGGLYNPPDGLTILLDVDGAYFKVDNGRIIDVLTHRNVTLPEPDKIEQHMEGNMVVAKIGTIIISVSDEVPARDYYFGIKTTDANVGAVYEGNSQLLAIKVVNALGVTCKQLSLCTYQLELGEKSYPINFRFNGTIENMTANTATQTLTIGLDVQSSGNLTIAIPREVVDSRAGSDRKSGADTEFAVFADEVNISADEYSPEEGNWSNALGITDHPEAYRIVVIPIKEGTERVDIVGTWEI